MKLYKADTNFTQVSNSVLNDPLLSLKAKGMYSYLFSKPDDWNFAVSRMMKDHKDGEDSTLSALKELERAGYLKRVKRPDGRVDYYLGIQITTHVEPDREIPKQGKPLTGKTPSLNKTELNTNTELISNIYALYQAKINSKSKLTDTAKDKIKTRLKNYSFEELKIAIEKFAGDAWWMKNNKHQGVAWFFNSDERIDRFMNLEGREKVKRTVDKMVNGEFVSVTVEE